MAPRQLLWASGVVIFLLMMATAFIGYVLPWGQMSFWGATVITNMATAIPVVGEPIVRWLWGGYTINNATLNRFFSLHFFLPFVIVGLTVIHLALLHKDGSNNPLGVDSGGDKVPFYPYFFVKDLFAFFCLLFIFGGLVYYSPNTLGHPVNYIPADPIHTPAHIVPEWYFLPFYAILRSIPNKIGGVLAMLFAILILFLLPIVNTSEIRSTTFRPLFKIFLWLLIGDFLFLGWVGQKAVRDTFIFVGQVGTVYYFMFFTVLVPVIGIIEKKLIRYKGNNDLPKPVVLKSSTMLRYVGAKNANFFVRVLHRTTVEKTSFVSMIFLGSFEILFNDTFYVLFAIITSIILTSTIFCLGLMHPDSIGKSICSFIKTNLILKLQKTLWKDLLFTYQPLEYKTVNSEKKRNTSGYKNLTQKNARSFFIQGPQR
jgi:hypothetical protein